MIDAAFDPQSGVGPSGRIEVNSAMRYSSDTDNYGAADYWASPAEAARRASVDCKEFARTKMWMLSALEVAPSAMRIVVLVDLRRNRGHAVLSVTVGGQNFILDNLSDEVKNGSADRLVSAALRPQRLGKLDLRQTPRLAGRERLTRRRRFPPHSCGNNELNGVDWWNHERRLAGT